MSIVVAFILFIAVASVAGIIADAIKKKAQLEVIRVAVEKGQPLDAGFVDKLMTTNKELENSPQQVATGLQIGSIMTASVGVGLPLLGSLIPNASDKFFRTMIGVGILLFCISAGLFISSRVVLRRSRTADRET